METFLNKLFQFSKGLIEIRPLPGKQRFFDIEDVAGIKAHCSEYQKSNLYFGVATRDGKGGCKENIVHIPCVWCDVDYKNTPYEVALQNFKEFPFKPSIIVKSGGGIHLYWFLKEPAEKAEISAIEDVNHRIVDQLGGDHGACDAARVLRVPGTKNRKPEYNPAPLCEITQQNDFYYTLNDFLEILPESTHQSKESKETASSNNVKDPEWLTVAMQGINKGESPGTSRNDTGTKIAGYFINKLPAYDVLTILKSWNLNNKPPLDEKELQTIVKSVSRYNPELSLKNRVDISNVYDSARMIEAYQEYIKNLKQNRFITGINEIDKRIRGVAGGEVLTIIARSGSFKTAMLQNLLKNYIQHSAWAAGFFSIEMPVASLTERYLEILDSATGKEVETMFRDESQAGIRQAATEQFIKDLERLFIVPTRVSLSDIAAYVQLIEREKNIKIGVIGIDYMGLMEGPGVNEYEIISRLSTGLKSTAKLLNIPVIVLAQTSRKGGGGTSEISLDMGRGSGAIEEAGDFVLGLWQVENETGEKDLICKILKNRKGPVGSRWKLDLIPQTLQIGADAEPYKPKEKKPAEGY